MPHSVKRVTILIGEEQHQRVTDLGLNLSGLIRDLLDDHFSDHKITLNVGQKTHELYQQVISSGHTSDEQLEPFILEGLQEIVRSNIEKMKQIEQSLERERTERGGEE